MDDLFFTDEEKIISYFFRWNGKIESNRDEEEKVGNVLPHCRSTGGSNGPLPLSASWLRRVQ